MKPSLYSTRPSLVLGFHGCDASVAKEVINGGSLKASTNDYDWLGHGIYFWENDYDRALDWAKQLSKRQPDKIQTPAVVGAIIDLGSCLDLINSHYISELKDAYKLLCQASQLNNKTIPKNTLKNKNGDFLLRRLDCAVIQVVHWRNKHDNNFSYDSVRAVFWEGNRIYQNAGFREKNHIQICVRNPNCIKGYFLPRHSDSHFPNP